MDGWGVQHNDMQAWDHDCDDGARCLSPSIIDCVVQYTVGWLRGATGACYEAQVTTPDGSGWAKRLTSVCSLAQPTLA
eukprot:836048-Pleurochrysis_carterae.AAC.2